MDLDKNAQELTKKQQKTTNQQQSSNDDNKNAINQPPPPSHDLHKRPATSNNRPDTSEKAR